MANFYDDLFLDELRSRNDIVEIISETVQLTQKGKSFKGLCPFHNEKTPSFNVDAEKQFFYCFGCHAGGNVIHFVQNTRHMSFQEAVKYLADRAMMDLPEQGGAVDAQKKRDYRKRLSEACIEAARYFHANLTSPVGSKALEYLNNRGVENKTIKRFGLGFAPDDWTSDMSYLVAKGFTADELQGAGLIINKRNEEGHYDAFRNRLMIPIIQKDGRVVGFGGRVLDDSLPKYINTPHTPIYNKGHMLFGLNLIKQSHLDSLIIVEGYMDCIALDSYGIKNVVASLGTALTLQQAKLIKRYTQKVFIAYDGDAAGQAAALRGMDILKDQGLDVRIIRLPEGGDPDDFIRENGVAAFTELIETAAPMTQYKLDVLSSNYDLTDDEDRSKYAVEACKSIKPLKAPVERERYIKYVASQTGYEINVLREQIKDTDISAGKNRFLNIRNNRNVIKGETSVDESAKGLLSLIAAGGESAVETLKNADESLFVKELEKKLYYHLIAAFSSGEVHIESILSHFEDPGEASAVMEVFNAQLPESAESRIKYMYDCIKRIRRQNVEIEISMLKSKLHDSKLAAVQREEIMRRITDLIAQIKSFQ